MNNQFPLKAILPAYIVYQRVWDFMTKMNPATDEGFLEDQCRLFTVLSHRKVDGRPIIYVTHAFKAPSLYRKSCHVNDIDSLDSVQFISNGLTIAARAAGFQYLDLFCGGLHHTHPGSPNTGPSFDDITTCKKNVQQTGHYFLFPISCRYANTKYTKWYHYDLNTGLNELSNNDIQVCSRDEILSVEPRMAGFLDLVPEHLLANISSKYITDRIADKQNDVPVAPLQNGITPIYTRNLPKVLPDILQESKWGRLINIIAMYVLLPIVVASAVFISNRFFPPAIPVVQTQTTVNPLPLASLAPEIQNQPAAKTSQTSKPAEILPTPAGKTSQAAKPAGMLPSPAGKTSQAAKPAGMLPSPAGKTSQAAKPAGMLPSPAEKTSQAAKPAEILPSPVTKITQASKQAEVLQITEQKDEKVSVKSKTKTGSVLLQQEKDAEDEKTITLKENKMQQEGRLLTK